MRGWREKKTSIGTKRRKKNEEEEAMDHDQQRLYEVIRFGSERRKKGEGIWIGKVFTVHKKRESA